MRLLRRLLAVLILSVPAATPAAVVDGEAEMRPAPVGMVVANVRESPLPPVRPGGTRRVTAADAAAPPVATATQAGPVVPRPRPRPAAAPVPATPPATLTATAPQVLPTVPDAAVPDAASPDAAGPATARAPARAERPRARPASLVASAEAEAALPPTRYAVARAEPPRSRPGRRAAAPDVTLATAPVAFEPVTTSLAPITREEEEEISVEIPDAGTAPAAIAPAPIRRAATVPEGIDLSATALIGIYGSPRSRRALVRLPTGTYMRLTRGDTIDGWAVAAIGDETVQLSKSGQNQVLRMPTN